METLYAIRGNLIERAGYENPINCYDFSPNRPYFMDVVISKSPELLLNDDGQVVDFKRDRVMGWKWNRGNKPDKRNKTIMYNGMKYKLEWLN